jgi:anti-sigma factor RsiW
MPECSHIDALVTPFVDDVLPEDERQAVTWHIAKCPACRGKVAVERSIRSLMQARRADLAAPASAELRSRCAALCSSQASPVVEFPVSRTANRVAVLSAWRARVAPYALAASLLLAVSGALIYQTTRSSSRVLAAELALDHEKCFRLNALLGTQHSADTVEAAMADGFDWHMTLPDISDNGDVSLIGSRPCLYGEGKTAHIMYRHNGQPVSLFMLPRESRADQLVKVLGHQARIWSAGDRTFVLVADESAPEMERMTALVRTTLR